MSIAGWNSPLGMSVHVVQELRGSIGQLQPRLELQRRQNCSKEVTQAEKVQREHPGEFLF